MIVTVLQTFVDVPKGRNEKRYTAGDVISMAKADYERIIKQNPALLFEGKKKMNVGTCYACRGHKNRKINK